MKRKAAESTNYSIDSSLSTYLEKQPVEQVMAPALQLLWLLPCPFCGHTPKIDEDLNNPIVDSDDEYIIGCYADDCCVQPFIVGNDLTKLTNDWNKRK
jgi:hypothetical protein